MAPVLRRIPGLILLVAILAVTVGSGPLHGRTLPHQEKSCAFAVWSCAGKTPAPPAATTLLAAGTIRRYETPYFLPARIPTATAPASIRAPPA